VGIFSRRRTLAATDVAPDPTPPTDPLSQQIAALQAARSAQLVTSRAQAIELSVVMRARDVVCGVLAQCPYKRTDRNGTDLGPGWLDRPDPNHTRGWWTAQLVDDLFFHGFAFAWITVVDQYGRPLAVEWMPYTQVIFDPDGLGVTYYRRGHDQPGDSAWWPTITVVHLSWMEVIVFESPLTAVLQAGRPLSTAARLDMAADRFANVEIPGGVLKQKSGDDLTTTEAIEQISTFEASRHTHTVAYVPGDLEYVPTLVSPDVMQLVESRSYQDAALARVCNVPAFAVGVGIPHESLTYKTAYTARADLVDFGIAPYIGAIEQTLSSDQVTPHGTVVTMDLEPFLRTDALRNLGTAGGVPADTAAAPTDTTPADITGGPA
jgi:phage portal protein BeeE